MSAKYPGGFITKSPVAPTSSAASGVWTLDQAMQYTKAGTWPTPGAWVDDVFSTYLYTGNSSTQTITNGIDLAGKGGLVWGKSRSGAYNHELVDTVRGAGNALRSNATAASTTLCNVTSFLSNGFTLDSGGGGEINANTVTQVSWTFRKAPKFFDVVTYTGNGTTQNIAHSLGVQPGAIIVKKTSATGNWGYYSNSLGATQVLTFNSTAAATTTALAWNDTAPTATQFTVGSGGDFNASGATYVAYLFAHDTDTVNGIVQCGSFTTDGSGNATVSLGWEPQYVLVKASTTASQWYVADSARGMPASGSCQRLYPNLSAAEESFPLVNPTATGFTSNGAFGAGITLIYLAIRRPNKPPTTGTQVFSPIASSAATGTALTTNFPVDMQIGKYRSGASSWSVVDRLRGVSTTSTEAGISLATNSTAAEGTFSGADSNNWGSTGFLMPTNLGGVSVIFYNFRRAPGVFDEVCYTGTGATSTSIPHSLGVAPELLIFKCRNGVTNWMATPCGVTGNDSWVQLQSTNAINNTTPGQILGNSTTYVAPSATQFTLGNQVQVNNSSSFNYVAYLFATKAGISKVGSYTGNGSSQTINAGFTTGARFVLIKRTDSTGDWYVWDSTRGIVAGNDPHLSLNTTAAEVTTDDSVDTDTSGFIVNQLAATNINVTSATYIYLSFA